MKTYNQRARGIKRIAPGSEECVGVMRPRDLSHPELSPVRSPSAASSFACTALYERENLDSIASTVDDRALALTNQRNGIGDDHDVLPIGLDAGRRC